MSVLDDEVVWRAVFVHVAHHLLEGVGLLYAELNTAHHHLLLLLANLYSVLYVVEHVLVVVTRVRAELILQVFPVAR